MGKFANFLHSLGLEDLVFEEYTCHAIGRARIYAIEESELARESVVGSLLPPDGKFIWFEYGGRKTEAFDHSSFPDLKDGDSVKLTLKAKVFTYYAYPIHGTSGISTVAERRIIGTPVVLNVQKYAA
jgi:hypothetical protein